MSLDEELTDEEQEFLDSFLEMQKDPEFMELLKKNGIKPFEGYDENKKKP